MAIGTPSLAASGSTSTDATSFDTASVSPASNSLLILGVGASAAAGTVLPTVTGNGLTWVEITHVDWASGRTLSAFRAMGASPSAGVVTMDFGGTTVTGIDWILYEITGCNTGGTNGSAAIIDSGTNTTGGATSISVDIGALAANDAAVGFFMSAGTGSDTLAAGTDFTLLGSPASISTPSQRFFAEYQLLKTDDGVVDGQLDDATSRAGGVIGIEVGAAAATGTSSSRAELTVLRRRRATSNRSRR